MPIWKYIRKNKNKSVVKIAEDNHVTRQTIYLFENGKLRSNKLMAYYLRLNGRDIDIKLAKILEEDYEEYYREMRIE